MSSLTSQLITPASAPAPASPAEGGDGDRSAAGEAVSAENDAERDALAAAGEASKLAAQLGGEMEKVAASGAQVSSGARDLQSTLMKLAHYVPELIRAAHARGKYAEFCLTEAARKADREVALKVASEMHADGLIEVPDGQTFEDVVDKLEGEDLAVFKRAHELFASGRLTSFGEVDETEKKAGEAAGRIGDSDEEFLKRHDWLLVR